VGTPSGSAAGLQHCGRGGVANSGFLLSQRVWVEDLLPWILAVEAGRPILVMFARVSGCPSVVEMPMFEQVEL
jgi:hypothetical protein